MTVNNRVGIITIATKYQQVINVLQTSKTQDILDKILFVYFLKNR